MLDRLKAVLAGAAPVPGSTDPLSAAGGPRTMGELAAVVPSAAVRKRPSAKDELLALLASKVMMGHLRNRHQLFGPPPTDFGDLDVQEAEFLVRAMIAAAHADGRLDSQEKGRIRDGLDRVGLGKDERGFLPEALRDPMPLDALLRRVQNPHVASRFYAASVLVLDKQLAVNRAYLDYLAQRLQLPPDVVGQVHRQFGYGT